MPRGDGTGPMGKGPRTGMGGARRRGGAGGGMGRGLGRMGGIAAGPGGECLCPKCGKKVPHEAGVPCTSIQCPECKIAMTRAR